MNEEDLRILADDLVIFLNGIEASCVQLRKQMEKLFGPKVQPKASIPEDRFNGLKWKPEVGPKIKEYEIALIQDNNEQDWRHCYNILQANSAVIGQRFHEEAYEFSYWLYSKMPYKIFRQRLAEAQK
jgi:hypothetical protein